MKPGTQPVETAPAWCCALLPALVVPTAIALVDSPWLWLVPVVTVAVVALGDECLPARRHAGANGSEGSRLCDGRAFPWGDVWLALYGAGLALFLWAGLNAVAHEPSTLQALSIALVMALLFSVAYNVAHDLIHRLSHRLRWTIGYLLLVLIGDAQLSVSHVYSHHPHVATRKDPASARMDESFYRFLIRSIGGQYLAAWHFEARRLRQASRSALSWRNRVLAGTLATLLLAAAFFPYFGSNAALIYLIACVAGKCLFEAANYIQHYGLQRRDGERVGPHHSWDCLAPLSRHFMFNQNHHADHHLRAASRCWELGPTAQAPLMPYGYLTMLALCTVPALWFRTMNPLAAAAQAVPNSRGAP